MVDLATLAIQVDTTDLKDGQADMKAFAYADAAPLSRMQQIF
ncbi:hypothetical protein SL1157_2741 [Ruegeria lacuscaerulensis ITI-1157]|nr:hypothetical protein SL1157_2741 [Ruegeria lacuscaerulensis ITI-1157]SHJ19961.1 hypothetical protein SAMN05444404_1676 [Ruegeria lacuscaerulensis ITI-1157]